MNRNQVHAGRHHLFHVFEHPRPGKSFALDQRIQDLRLVACSAVLREAEKFFGLGAELVALRDILAQVSDRGPVAARVVPAADGSDEQRSERMLAIPRAVPQRSQNSRASW
jgi:hypothetical protein